MKEYTTTFFHKVAAVIIMTFIYLIFLSIVLRMGAKFCINHGVDNKITQILYMDQPNISYISSMDSGKKIDWTEKYSFEDTDIDLKKKDNFLKTGTESYLSFVSSVQSKIENFTTTELFGYPYINEFAKKCENIMKWKLTVLSDMDNPINLGNGYYARLEPKVDVSKKAVSTAELCDFCSSIGTDFMYVQVPSKLDKEVDSIYSGIYDFSNQNADAFLEELSKRNVNYLDLRKNIMKEELELHSLFFKADHHWLPRTGLWAANKIAEELKNSFAFECDTNLLNPDLFYVETYKNWFLGSSGRKVTLSRSSAENFELYYPKFPAYFTYEIPSLDLMKTGDFSVMYDMRQMAVKDFYYMDPYAAYNYGSRDLIHIHNNDCINDKKVLIIEESFSHVLVPFLSLEFGNIDVIDIRFFNGSIRSYIKKTQPDIVLVIYNPRIIADDTSYENHKNMYDFR